MFPTLSSLTASGELNSELQGPIFIHEPPNTVSFLNSSGAVIQCSAHGVPPPSISWFTKEGLPVPDLPGLRYVRPDGSLVFAPFPAEAYSAEIHGTVYRCQASNRLGTALSRDCIVRAGE